MSDKKPSQTDLLYKLLSDGIPHRTDEIMALVYGDNHLGLARVGARVWDVQKKYRVIIEGWHDADNRSLYWYQIKNYEINSIATADARTPETILNFEKTKQATLF